MYETVDLQSPAAAQLIGIILLVVGLAVLGHALWRRRRYREGTDDDARWDGPSGDADARRESWAGIGVLVLGAAAVGYALWGSAHAQDVLTENLRQKYGVESVEQRSWQGSALTADLTMPDGTVHQDVVVRVGSAGEPEIAPGVLD